MLMVSHLLINLFKINFDEKRYCQKQHWNCKINLNIFALAEVNFKKLSIKVVGISFANKCLKDKNIQSKRAKKI